MVRSVLQSVLKLSKAERILLVEQIWDSIADRQEGPPLTEGQQAELDRRLNRLAQTGPQGDEWAAVRKRIAQKAKR